jgi:hypothetical protein
VNRSPFDLVVFWKQNDSGIYGRRSDLLVHELGGADRVRSTTHFDAPLGAEALRRMSESDGTDHQRLVFERTTAAAAADIGERFCRRTFLFDDCADPPITADELTERFGAFVAEVLAARGVGAGDRPTVFLVYPTNRHLAALIDRFRPTVVVADVVDDNRTWYPAGSAQYRALTANYQQVLQRSDVVLANCTGVADAIGELRADVEVVPNACEPPGAHGEPTTAERPDELAALDGPVIGYAGNLSSRIDVGLLEHVATSCPDWNIVLIGSTHAGREAHRLRKLPNVTLLGPRPYDEAKRYIRSFDVAIIPHVDDVMTRSMQPLKAYVYASLGVPVVSTPIANLPDLGPAITVADDRAAFVHAIGRLLATGRPSLTPATRDLLRQAGTRAHRPRPPSAISLGRTRLMKRRSRVRLSGRPRRRSPTRTCP